MAQFALMLAVLALGVVWRGRGWGLLAIAGGIVLVASGAWFGIAGVAALGRNRTAFPRPHDNSQLIRHGIYARVRHPLYSCVMLISLAWALLWQSWPALLAALVSVPFFHAKARCEERWLREKFPGYLEYARRVPRFVPRWRTPANLICNL